MIRLTWPMTYIDPFVGAQPIDDRTVSGKEYSQL